MKKCNKKNIKSILNYTYIIIISVLLYISSTLYGDNYYVSTNGSNVSAGTNWQTAWETIGYAASNVGAGSVVTVSNGVYNEKVVIQSNGTHENLITFKALNQGQAIVDGTGNNYCFDLNWKSYIRIKGFKITKATNYGIYINNTNNYIVKNTIYSNKSHGIRITDGNNNFILSNHIYGNMKNGIDLWSADNNTIKSNCIYNHINNSAAIIMNAGSSSNIINKNIIYSNNGGVSIYSNISTHNHISSNCIFGLNQDCGVAINGKYNHVYYNEIYYCTNGISIGIFSKSNYISHNNIFSNSINGISIFQGNYNSIFSNNIYGHSQNIGIRIQQGTNNRIYRNLIYNNEQNGIWLTWHNLDIDIINNTIFGSISSNGVLWTGDSSGVMYNNIILSNGNGAGDYGIANLSAGSVHVAYNDIYGNFAGPTNGTLIWGSGNITNNPMIDIVSSFEITSADSPCVDTGTNIPGITDGHKGTAPDMGWKEFPLGAGYTALVVFPDKSPGQYIGDLELCLTAYKDASKNEIDSTAVITVTVFRNGIVYQELSDTGVLEMILSAGYEYKLSYYAKDISNNTSQTQEAEYVVLQGMQKDIAVYPTVVNVNQDDKVTFLYKEKISNVDITICTIRGDIVKEIKGVDFSTGVYAYNTKELRFLPAGLYLLRIKDKKALLMIVK